MNKEMSRMLYGVADVDKFAETASQGNGNGWHGGWEEAFYSM